MDVGMTMIVKRKYCPTSAKKSEKLKTVKLQLSVENKNDAVRPIQTSMLVWSLDVAGI